MLMNTSLRGMTFLLATFIAGTAFADGALQHELVVAKLGKDKAKIEALIARGADVNAVGEYGDTPLVLGMDQGCGTEKDYEIAKLLIDKGADVNKWLRVTNFRQTPLHIAVLNDCEGEAELFIAKGARLDVKNYNGQTPLDMVIKIKDPQRQKTMREILLDPRGTKHPEVEKLRVARDLNSKLFLAISNSPDSKAMVDDLLTAGADVNARNEYGWTPLDEAVGNVELVALLVAHAADVNSTDYQGRSPLHHAAEGGNSDAAELLLSHGADIGARDVEGNTPLHYAAQAIGADKQHRLLEILIAKGADLNAQNKKGDTPLQSIDPAKTAGGMCLLPPSYRTDPGCVITRGNIVAFLHAEMSKGLTPQRRLSNYLEQFKGHTENEEMRTDIITLARTLAPAVPDAAEASAGRGAYIFKSSKSNDDTLSAAKEYLAAIEAAPWVANYYYNLCTVLEKTPYKQQALRACKLYLVAAPDAPDVGEMKQRIAGIQYATDADKTLLKQRNLYIKHVGIEELYKLGGLSGTVAGKGLVLTLIADWNSSPPNYRVYLGCAQSDNINGTTHELVTTDTWTTICNPPISFHLLIKPDGDGFVEVSNASGERLRTTISDLFIAKRKVMDHAVMFHSTGAAGDRFYTTYGQGGVDERQAGYTMFETDCRGSPLKEDPRALPDAFVPLEVSKTGHYGSFVPEVDWVAHPNIDLCSRQFASKTGYHFGESE